MQVSPKNGSQRHFSDFEKPSIFIDKLELMTTIKIVLSGLVIAGFIAIYLPRLFVIHKEKLTRQQFVERFPEFYWIENDLITDFLVFVFAMFGATIGFCLLQTPLSLGLFSILFAGPALLNGWLTATTGICRVPYPKMPYEYLHNDSLRKVGQAQIIISVITIVAAIALALYKGPL